VSYFGDISPRVASILYFGDLDLEGSKYRGVPAT